MPQTYTLHSIPLRARATGYEWVCFLVGVDSAESFVNYTDKFRRKLTFMMSAGERRGEKRKFRQAQRYEPSALQSFGTRFS